MKKLVFILVMLLISGVSFANEAYQKAMKLAIDRLFQTQTIQEYVDVANQFERISTMEKKEWLPLYYASFSYIMISFKEADNARKDQYLDQAQKYLDQAMSIDANESELYMLQGFLYPSRINIDPINRGMAYMGKMNAALDKALELNPDNPRVFYLRATMTANMPEAFGGGAAKALTLYQKAAEKFELFKPKSEIHPNWGKELNASELQKIQK
jgi:tetratricopeptide (TPR) repeat protein